MLTTLLYLSISDIYSTIKEREGFRFAQFGMLLCPKERTVRGEKSARGREKPAI